MHNTHFKAIRSSISHWYIIFLIGLIYLGLGLMIMLRPEASLIALDTLLGICFLIAGAIEIVFSITNRREIHHWGWPLVMGIVTILIGVLFLSNPKFSILLITLTLGFLVLFRSIAAVTFSLELKQYGARFWSVLMGIAILGIFFAFTLLMSHMLGSDRVVLWTWLALLSAGLYNLVLSLRLRKLKGISARLSEELMAKYREIQREIQEELRKESHSW